MRSIDRGRV
uniref:Uncharacterized protein n=3 Tax=Oryza TaxID=4527 RepID=A0A0G2KBM2_9ORYZ